MDRVELQRRAREDGVNSLVYWIVRGLMQPFFLLYFRMRRIGLEHVPDGPVIFAANHRSFLDPFVIATVSRRPIYYVAKQELFSRRPLAWVLNALGAFPVNRGSADEGAIDTAKAILARGESVLIFPEGTRTRPGPLGAPKRGVGRLALEAGVPVLPVAVLGTEDVRQGWRIRPRHVQIRIGRPLTFPRLEHASPQLAAAVTDRIWPCVALQWEWLGGTPPLRRAAVIGAGAWGTALAATLARAGLEVQLGTRTTEGAATLTAARENVARLPGVILPEGVQVARAVDLPLGDVDLVVFATPARDLPAAVAAHGGRIPESAGVLVGAKGLVPPLGTLPCAYVAERVRARAVACVAGPAHAADAVAGGASVVVASLHPAFSLQIADALATAGWDATTSDDVTGVELAATAKNAAALAAAAAVHAGPNVAGAAAGKVFAELGDYATRRGGRPESFAGLAGTGDLVATALAHGSRNRRAGELLAAGVPAAEISPALGHTAEAIDTIPLLARALHEARVPAPAVTALADLVEGRVGAESWTAAVTAPAGPQRTRRAA